MENEVFCLRSLGEEEMRLTNADVLYCDYQDKVCNNIACCECRAVNADGTCKLDLFLTEAPTITTKPIKYYDEDEGVWKIGEVIVDD